MILLRLTFRTEQIMRPIFFQSRTRRRKRTRWREAKGPRLASDFYFLNVTAAALKVVDTAHTVERHQKRVLDSLVLFNIQLSGK
jgi:hypothetical protein